MSLIDAIKAHKNTLYPCISHIYPCISHIISCIDAIKCLWEWSMPMHRPCNIFHWSYRSSWKLLIPMLTSYNIICAFNRRPWVWPKPMDRPYCAIHRSHIRLCFFFSMLSYYFLYLYRNSIKWKTWINLLITLYRMNELNKYLLEPGDVIWVFALAFSLALSR